MNKPEFLETWSNDNVPEAWRTAGRKDLDAIFDEACEQMNQRLEINRLCGVSHAEKMIREDAITIVNELRAEVKAHLNAPTDYLKPEGE